MQLPESARLKPISIEDEMRSSFLEYSMSVIVSRALPDIRDGLKPVHRRILYAMQTLGNVSGRAYKKSARTVGEVIAKYHPHGDSAVYDSLVRMAQDFSLRYPLVDGQGNFGSVDGDSPAAMRYTEARLSKMAGEMLEDLDRDTVDFVTNYDESEQEPSVLPGKLPNLLINGTGGIAVGMATNIPPHNLREVVSALCLLIDNPETGIDELIGLIPGPDFPTGGEIHGKSGIRSAYHTGRGLVVMRGTASIEENEKSRDRIIITEIPYQVNKSRMIEKIADLVRDKKITGISDIRDESDRHGMRVVIELKRDAIGQVILNQLYKHTQLQDTFGVIMIALVNGRPKQLNLKEVLAYFLEHRREIITRRTLFDLAKANARRHILDGFKIALDNLSAIIELIRNATSPDVAREGLIDQFALSEIQAKSILEMRLSRLTGLERQKVLDELEQIVKTIEDLEFIRDNESEKYQIIKDELTGLAETYGDDRRTRLLDVESEVDIEDLIPDDDMVIAISTGGYIKRNALAEYKAQKRGGKGVRGISMKDEDVVQQLFSASNHTTLLFFTNQGRVFKKKVYEIPESGRVAKGKAIVNLLALRQDEKVARILPVKDFDPSLFLLMATKKGIVKKSSLSQYANINVSGINAIDLVEGDSVISADITDGNKTVLIETKAGFAINFDESDARPMGRVSRGVRGIRLSTDTDEAIGMEILDKEADSKQTIFSIKDNGFGKRTDIARYPLQKRGGKGVIDIKTEGSAVITIKKVSQGDQLMIITRHGVVIRIDAMDVSEIGRNTKGVKVISVKGDDKVVSVARIGAEAETEVEAEAEAETNGEDGTQTE